MRIQSNISAINTQRQMFRVNNAQSKALEKLSSGFRINRAADDAAGLAISEKMRSQIRGMRQASRNAQDGISVVQTAEGALDEVHSMLQRMKELAVQSANDSNQSLVDREAIQLEVDALTEEINSITEKTQFNKMRLLDGTFQGKHFHVGANSNQTIGISIDSMTAQGLGLRVGGREILEDTFGQSRTINVRGTTPITPPTDLAAGDVIEFADDLELGKEGTAKFKVAVNGQFAEFEVQTGNDGKIKKNKLRDEAIKSINAAFGSTIVEANGDGKVKLKEALKSSDGVTGAYIKVTLENEHDFDKTNMAAMTLGKSMADGTVGTKTAAIAEVSHEAGPSMLEISLNGQNPKMIRVEKGDDKAKIEEKIDAAFGTGVIKAEYTAPAGGTQGIIKLTTIALGADVSLDIRATAASGQKVVDYKGVNVLTRENANRSMDNVQEAIETLASRRAKLGAIQNRIEHTIANLDNSHENLKAAEARVRDTDMAEMIIESARTSILSQAAISMLSQANQVPQNVLSLLR